NLPEAETILDRKIETLDDMRAAARQLVEQVGSRAVVVKGGHLDGPAVDVFFDGSELREFSAERIDTQNTHGTGCTFASAIAAHVARGEPLAEAVALAKQYLTEALRSSYPVGAGHGPVHHFWKWWQSTVPGEEN